MSADVRPKDDHVMLSSLLDEHSEQVGMLRKLLDELALRLEPVLSVSPEATPDLPDGALGSITGFVVGDHLQGITREVRSLQEQVRSIIARTRI